MNTSPTVNLLLDHFVATEQIENIQTWKSEKSAETSQ